MQVLAVALATTVTMVAGVLLASEFMLVSDHDLAVLAVVLVVAGSVAGGAALYLGDMYERDTREVADLAERLVDPSATADDSGKEPILSGDLQRLADQLSDVFARLEVRDDESGHSMRRAVSSSRGSPTICDRRSRRSVRSRKRSRMVLSQIAPM